MSFHNRSRALAIVLTVVPGWGHVYWGLEKLGLALFTLFAVSAFAVANASLVALGAWSGPLLAVTAIVCGLLWGYAFVDILRRTSARRLADEEAQLRDLLVQGVIYYLHDELEKSTGLFQQMVRLDPLDFEARFRLGVVASRLGDAKGARRWFQQAAKHDVEGKWAWEIRHERDRLRSNAPSRDPSQDRQGVEDGTDGETPARGSSNASGSADAAVSQATGATAETVGESQRGGAIG